jgi:hypothetical protein
MQCTVEARDPSPSVHSSLSQTASPAGDAKKLVIVETAEALTKAILKGSTHIEIREHLDLTKTASFGGVDFPIKLPLLSTTESIRVRLLLHWWVEHCCEKSLKLME